MENKNELPKMTIEQRNAIVNPIIGLEIIDSDTNELMRFDGIEFVKINNHKQEAIKKAYGEYYDICKPNENGWTIAEFFPYGKMEPEYGEDYGNDLHTFYIRPKSLQGIETNNGWINTLEMLPNEHQNCYVVKSGKITTASYVKDDRWFVRGNGFPKTTQLHDITHWQPIQVPPKPIY